MNSEGPGLVEEELFPTTPGPAPETTPMPTTPGPAPETTPMPPSDSPALDEDNLFIAAIQQYENSQGSKKIAFSSYIPHKDIYIDTSRGI